MGRLFGTDGIRGVVNAGLDAELAYKVGLAAAQVLSEEKKDGRPLFTIGKDTRISCDLLKGALIGAELAGADVQDLGTIPTGGGLGDAGRRGRRRHRHPASHNPLSTMALDLYGRASSVRELEAKIEDILLERHNKVPRKTHGEIGRSPILAPKASEDYIDHLVSTVDSDLAGLRILVDCANGAASATAARLFDRFSDLHTDVINADPDAVNINAGCGSTHLEGLAAMVQAGGYDLGVAFDGDADRCPCSEAGRDIDGDQIMAVGPLAAGRQGCERTWWPRSMSTSSARFDGKRDAGWSVPKGDATYWIKLPTDIVWEANSPAYDLPEHATTAMGELTALQFLSLPPQRGSARLPPGGRLQAVSPGAGQCGGDR
jgi:phosphoglucosamine mutase